ncbi:MAG: magnesium/cobalt transporter CorA [Methylococcaceae bacterium]|nr:magnesium/cobalt transporter CorA [Methylococcaceae bacterium]
MPEAIKQNHSGNPKTYQAMVMQCVAYTNGVRTEDIGLEEISEVIKRENTFIWLGLREPNAPLLEKIQQEFGLHELAIEDTRTAHQRPKLEEYGDTLFLVMQTAQLYRDSVQFGESHIFAGPNFIITVRHGSSLSYRKIRERCENMPQSLAKGPGFVLYALIDFIVDNYMPVVDGLQERFERLEEDIFKNRFNQQTLEKLYDLKHELLMLRSAAAPLQDICNELMRFHSHVISQDVQFYYRDISDHVKRIDQAIDSMREMLTAAMQVYLALLTVGQNEIVKRLAGWGAILALPTMVFSLYGMNFKNMPELEWPYSYHAVLASLALACGLLYRQLKKSGWL